MSRSSFISLGLAAALFAIAILFHLQLDRPAVVDRYATTLENYLQEQESRLRDLFRQEEKLADLLFEPKERDNLAKDRGRQKFIEELNAENFTLTIYQGDQLLFWSNNKALPENIWKNNWQRDTVFVNRHSNGSYAVFYRAPGPLLGDDYTIYGLVPLKYRYPINSDYLHDGFPEKLDLPPDLELSTEKTSAAVHLQDGRPLFHLKTQPVRDRQLLSFSLLLFVAAFIPLGIFLHALARLIAHHYRLWMGVSFLTLAIVLIRFISLSLNVADTYSHLFFFRIPFNIPFNPTLGDFLINVLLLLWVLFFMLAEIRTQSLEKHPLFTRLLYAFSTYLIIVIWVLFICAVIKELVIHTPINFNAPSVFNLDQSAWMAVLCIILLMIAIYLFSHRRMIDVLRTRLPLRWRWPLLVLAAAIAYPAQAIFIDLTLSPWLVTGLAFLILLAFEIFEHSQRQGFLWLMLWLILLSALPAFLLYQYVQQKGLIERKLHVQRLAQLRDAEAEPALQDFVDRLADDPELPYLLEQLSSDSLLDKQDIEQRIEEFFSLDNYLYYNYRFNIFAFFADGSPGFSHHLHIGRRRLRSGIKTRNELSPQLSFAEDLNKRPFYLAELRFPLDSQYVDLMITFRRNRKERSDVYCELLIDRPYKGLPENYEFGIYEPADKDMIDQEGGFNLSLSRYDFQPGAFREITRRNTSYLAYYRAGEAIAVVKGQNLPTRKYFEFFCFFFGLFIILVLLVALINTAFNILPRSLNLSIAGKPSLRKRIQFAIFALTVAFFITTAIVTVQFFRDSSTNYHEGRLERKTRSVLSDASHELEILGVNLYSFPREFAPFIDDLAEIHRIDINLYDLNGWLLRSSEEDFFRHGIQSRHMNPAAYHALRFLDKEQYAIEEQIGRLNFQSSYVPLKIAGEDEGVTIAYLGLPYYSGRRDLRSDMTLFMDDLLYVYVACIIIAILLSVAMANSIAGGVIRISEKFRNFSLDGPNERLEVKVDDELGELVRVYNKMSEELERSAQRLAQSERESAWREMAKQVAHEIKNPLTPMKLSIQYLIHAYKNNPENLEEMVKRVSSTLMEQIENLSEIASEFSTFAKMPKAKNERLELNHLVIACVELFEKNEKGVAFELSLPPQPVYVFADRHQITSVLNNLLKNGQEAIPDEREGRIEVTLRKKEGKAIIRVRDNGTGIPEDIQQKVFQPNFTTKGSGTGLGLAICNNIIQNADGRIYFETGPDGTTFFVELPLLGEVAVLSPDNYSDS